MASPGVIHWVQQGFPDIAGAMKASTPVIEESREFFGLVIAFATMLALVALGRACATSKALGLDSRYYSGDPAK